MTETSKMRIYLSEWLTHLGLTQQELANRMGTDKSSVSRYVKDRRGVSQKKASEIADALGIDPVALFLAPDDAEAAALINRFKKFIDREGVNRAKLLMDAIDPLA
jgi:transcriptional regulator with XRE-family HTH domain